MRGGSAPVPAAPIRARILNPAARIPEPGPAHRRGWAAERAAFGSPRLRVGPALPVPVSRCAMRCSAGAVGRGHPAPARSCGGSGSASRRGVGRCRVGPGVWLGVSLGPPQLRLFCNCSALCRSAALRDPRDPRPTSVPPSGPTPVLTPRRSAGDHGDPSRDSCECWECAPC